MSRDDICIYCRGTRDVVDLGSGEIRPCIGCRQDEYRAWIRERQPQTRRRAQLDSEGRCCGRKPIVYKRPYHHFFCHKCCADLSPDGQQIPNWAWVRDGDAFVATSPTHEYAKRAGAKP